MKSCPKCKQEKELSEFYSHWHKRDKRYRIDSYCKLCSNTRSQEYENSENGKKKRKDSRLKRMFGISAETWDAWYSIQDGKCAICKQLFGDTRFIHTDHDHETGKVRGLLCHLCNTKLDWYITNENPIREYLYGPWANLTSESITGDAPWTTQELQAIEA